MYITTVMRSGNNPVTGRAQYRVVKSCETMFYWPKVSYCRLFKWLYIETKSTKKVGSIINPRKELFS